MKNLIALALLTLVSPLALAEDAVNNAENTVDASKNPITGTVTVTRKHKRKLKNGKNQAKLDVTEKTKIKKDGEVDKSVDVKKDSSDYSDQAK